MQFRLRTLLIVVTLCAFAAWAYFIALPAYRIALLPRSLETVSTIRVLPASGMRMRSDSFVDSNGRRATAIMNGVVLKLDDVEIHADRAFLRTAEAKHDGLGIKAEVYVEGNVTVTTRNASLMSDAVYLRTGRESVFASELPFRTSATSVKSLSENQRNARLQALTGVTNERQE